MKQIHKDILDAVALVASGERETVVVFNKSLKTRVKATIVQKFNRRGINIIKVTIGRLNSRERDYVKLCRKYKCKPRRQWFPRKRKG